MARIDVRLGRKLRASFHVDLADAEVGADGKVSATKLEKPAAPAKPVVKPQPDGLQVAVVPDRPDPSEVVEPGTGEPEPEPGTGEPEPEPGTGEPEVEVTEEVTEPEVEVTEEVTEPETGAEAIDGGTVSPEGEITDEAGEVVGLVDNETLEVNEETGEITDEAGEVVANVEVPEETASE